MHERPSTDDNLIRTKSIFRWYLFSNTIDVFCFFLHVVLASRGYFQATNDRFLTKENSKETLKEVLNFMASLAASGPGCYFSMFSLKLVTFNHIFNFFFFAFLFFFIEEHEYLLCILTFIGGTAFFLYILLQRLFLGIPYLTLFIRLYL